MLGASINSWMWMIFHQTLVRTAVYVINCGGIMIEIFFLFSIDSLMWHEDLLKSLPSIEKWEFW
jgi:hypothetical protein